VQVFEDANIRDHGRKGRPALDDPEKRNPRHGGPATAEASDFQRVISDDPTQTFLDDSILITREKMIAT
jgi:hypothetical protein